MVVGRILSILAAILLVSAVALAMLGPRGMTLGYAVTLLDQGALASLQSGLSRPAWLWDGVARPLLVRPAWLLPAAFGLIAGGFALSLSWSRVPSSQKRRRS